jgi:hypothetical protein
MYDRINPPDYPVNNDELNNCDRCNSRVHESDAHIVWISAYEEKQWCPYCYQNHSATHPLFKDEQWAIGSIDNENNLIIK